MTVEAPRCCGVVTPWREMDYFMATDGEDGLLWLYVCPLCGTVLRSDPFNFPNNFEPKK